MKILVTGGLGFIGSNFCRSTIRSHPDAEVTNVDKIGLSANPTSLKDIDKEKRYRFVKGDIRNPKLMKRLVVEAEAIVNFAAETHVDRSITDPSEFLHNNTLGTFTLLEAVREHNRRARFVQVSTDEVYGETAEDPFTEDDPPRPSNPYSASKAAADMLVNAYFKTYKLNAAITRCTNNYGPYQFPEKLIPKTIIRALKNLKIPLYGTGKNIRDWIYVLDHCEAVHLVLTKGQAGRIYNIAAGNETSNIEIVKKILKQLGKHQDLIAFVEDRPGHDARYSLDSSRIRSELGWKPKHSFEKALKDTVDWYIHNESWWKQLATEQVLSPTPWKKSEPL
ncbi:MAG: dTDP-glucose 4,6-dehydratase [Candidatus Bathyarchaeia archaeon]|jgi:dTDP-glucose 4,6-dehydratase